MALFSRRKAQGQEAGLKRWPLAKSTRGFSLHRSDFWKHGEKAEGLPPGHDRLCTH